MSRRLFAIPKWKAVLGFDDGVPPTQYNPPPSPPYSDDEKDPKLGLFLPPRSGTHPSQQQFPPMPRDITFTRTCTQDLMLSPSSPAPSRNDIKPLPDPPALFYMTNQQDDTSPSEFKIPPKPDLMLHSGPSRTTSIISFAQFHTRTLATDITLCPVSPQSAANRRSLSQSFTSNANPRHFRSLSSSRSATPIFSAPASNLDRNFSPISSNGSPTSIFSIPESDFNSAISPIGSSRSATPVFSDPAYHVLRNVNSIPSIRSTTPISRSTNHSRNGSSVSSKPYFCCEKLVPIGGMFRTGEKYAFHIAIPKTGLREKFEWRHSSGPFIRTIDEIRHSTGLELVRCFNDETVAVFAGLSRRSTTKNPRKVVGMFRFLGDRLGEEFDVYAVMSILAIVERSRRVVEANRLNMGN